MININELDPIRRYLPAAERPRPSSRYSSFQVWQTTAFTVDQIKSNLFVTNYRAGNNKVGCHLTSIKALNQNLLVHYLWRKCLCCS